MKTVTVVLPTYNEKANIGKTIEKVFEQEKSLPGFQIQIIVADDIRSRDGTEQIVKELINKNKKIHLIKVEPGLGVGLIKGHQYALEHIHPDILAQLDADGQVAPDVLVKLIKAIEEGYSLAIGSRFISGGKNQLSLIRKLFTYGASFFCRLLIGPWEIREVTNSARAFTPELFRKINLERLPWKEQTFIVQPAFLHEAILAGAKYKEVPLVFKNRLEGYSKNKVFNYSYDVIAYCTDVKLHQLGINIPIFRFSRRAKTLVKFSLVGVVGTLVDFLFYKIFIAFFGFAPPVSKLISTTVAVQNNFVLNNFWTFKMRKTKNSLSMKWLIFNVVSSGGVLLSFGIVLFLHSAYGDGFIKVFGRPIAYNNFYFFATIPPVMLWNFTVNHFVTWRRSDD